ncbi:MAG TPA: hypothetical protein VHE30_26155 [Polyangiaceae bacterium]|nr:hypothetical protein [Polyangiaceae bacterium]
MLAWKWRVASFIGLSTGLLAGCRSVSALKQRCLAGDGSSCEAACSKGVLGEGGCFHAAEDHRRRAAGDPASAEGRRATELYEKACAGGIADGCLYAAQALEAPFTGGPNPAGAPPPLISDELLAKRDRKLDRACSLGSPEGCKRLGDATIGRDAARAKGAYLKACRTSADANGCEAARGHEVDVADRYRSECVRHVADSCASLGDFLFAVDPPRAARVFAGECELRGVADLAGGVAAFVALRERQAARGIPLVDGQPHAAPAPPPSAPKVLARAEVVRGRVAVVEIDRVLARHADDLAACTAALTPKAPLLVEAELVVDRTGDVFRATVPDGVVDAGAARCLGDALESLSFSEPLGDLPQIRVSLTISPAEVAKVRP